VVNTHLPIPAQVEVRRPPLVRGGWPALMAAQASWDKPDTHDAGAAMAAGKLHNVMPQSVLLGRRVAVVGLVVDDRQKDAGYPQINVLAHCSP